jgi:hypothetical protein
MAGVLVYEKNDDSIYYGVGGKAFPVPDDALFEVVNNGAVDTGPAVLNKLEFLPGSVDVTTAAQEITVRIEAADDIGVEQLEFSLTDPTGATYLPADAPPMRVSGDAGNGVYKVTITIPMGSPTGPWDAQVILGDLSHRYLTYGNRDFDEPFPAGSDSALEVVSPNSLPVLENLIVTPDVVNVTAGAQIVTIRAEVSASAGIERTSVSLTDPRRSLAWSLTSFDRISGDASAGTYELQVMIPPFLPSGSLDVKVAVYDVAGQVTRHGPGEQAFPPGATPSITIINSGTTDNTPPKLESLSFNPTVIAPSDGPVTITVTVAASDDTAGFDNGGVTFFNGNNFVKATSFTEAQRVNGDATSGTYVFDMTLPNVPAGANLRADVILRDKSKLFATYGDPPRLPLPEGTIPLQVSELPLDAYDVWLAGYPQIPASERGFDQDSDQDGFQNGLEFVLGMNPAKGDILMSLQPVFSMGKFGLRVVVSEANLTLGAGTAATMRCEFSTDGKNWEPMTQPAAIDGLSREYLKSVNGKNQMLARFVVDYP